MAREFWIALVLLVAVLLGISLVTGNLRLPSTPVSPSSSARPTGSSTPAPTPSSTPTPKPTVAPTPTPTPVPTPPPPPPPTVRISGSGSGNSRVFQLGDGRGYLVQYTLSGSCAYYAELISTDGSYDNTDFIQDSGPTSSTKLVSARLFGAYYVAMQANGGGCGWSMTFLPE